jgi:hypothetical protein
MIKNIWKAYKSTILGLSIPVLTAVYQGLSTPPVNWKAIGTSVVLAVILSVTDLLKEKQKQP